MYKTIRRSKEDAVLLGVCGGISEHYELDSNFVRFFALLLTLVAGIGPVIYLAGFVTMWINNK